MNLWLLNKKLLLYDKYNIIFGIGNWIRFMKRLFEENRIMRDKEFENYRKRILLYNIKFIIYII